MGTDGRHPLPMPGVWTDDNGGLHIDITELLAAAGYADTPANRATMIEAVRRQAAGFNATVTEVEDDGE